MAEFLYLGSAQNNTKGRLTTNRFTEDMSIRIECWKALEFEGRNFSTGYVIYYNGSYELSSWDISILVRSYVERERGGGERKELVEYNIGKIGCCNEEIGCNPNLQFRQPKPRY